MKKKYFKIITIFVLLLAFTATGFSQNRERLWTKTSKERLANADLAERKAVPNDAQYFQLNLELLKQELTNAPDRNLSSEPSNLIINFPDAEGKLEPFSIKEASILAPELQRQVPQIRSYIGVSLENPSTIIRFSVTPQGLHTITLSNEKGTQYIDPYTTNSNAYLVYARKNLPVESRSFECEFEDDGLQADFSNVDEAAFRNANDGQMRTFRLALACTGEYAEFHWTAAGLNAGSPEALRRDAVLAAMVVTMTRVNALYERELSLNMTLVPNLDIIFLDAATDPYTNNNGAAMLTQNQTEIDNTIGSANYDIGHVFSTGGGGIASLTSPCVTGFKARGVTGLPQPVGDIFDYEYVAHEMGHQYGSPHTWNGNEAGCSPGQRSSADAYEPGSGSTIMGYAGLCGSQNVQTFTDIYFHQRSLLRIWSNITNGNSQCATTAITGNTAPTADAGSNYIIPRSTPYKLTGSSTDVDGVDTHTFTWEQYDLGPAGAPTETTASGPLVRSFVGTANPTRYIPNLEDLADVNGSTNWEKLASVDRDINFRLTVRDNDSRGGQTASDNMTVDINPSAGPFVVTSQTTTNISWTQGETETITWNVAGTTGNGINAANVNILLSTNGGLSYDTILASNVPNDGSHDITVPNIIEPFCRVMVEAVGNIFFSINLETFAIGTTVEEVCNDYESGNIALAIPDGLGTPGNPVQGTPVFSSITVTEDVIIDGNIKFNVDITHPNTGEFIIQLQHPDVGTNNAFVNVWVGNCNGNSSLDITFADGAPAFVCANPTSGEYSPANPLTVFDGLSSAGDWNIAVVEFFQGNTGTLNDWAIEICTTSLSTDEFDLQDNLVVYPNPNNGEFSIKLKSNSGKDINVEVFDIRGRSILNNSYRNTGDFNQTISLDNAQSGMYLLNINDGDKKLTKKIIVN